MIDLIMVGMRFCNGARPKVGQKLYLVKEPNNSVNKDAVAVYNKHEVGSEKLDQDKVGYVRDADLKELYQQVVTWPIEVKVTRVATNWMKLNPLNQITYKADLLSNPYSRDIFREIFDKHHGDSDIAYQDILQDVRNEVSYTSINEPYWPIKSNDTNLGRTIREEIQNRINESTEKQKPKIEEKTMFNTVNFKDSFFKEVKNVAMDMQTGKLGVITKDGIVVATDDGVSINPITEMGFKIPAFAMRVPIENLTKGDILISGDEASFFLEASKTGYLTINTKGVMQETGNVTNMFFGKNTVLAVKNMFGDSSNGMNPMMMAMAFGDGEFDFKKMLMLQMFSGGGNADFGGGGMNPMMMFALFGDKLK